MEIACAHLMPNGQALKPNRAILNDSSEYLMGIYRCMKNDPQRLYDELERLYKTNSQTLHTTCKNQVCHTDCEFQRSAMFWYLLRSSLYSFVCMKKDGSSFTCCYRKSTSGRPLKLKTELYWDLVTSLRKRTVRLYSEDFKRIIKIAKSGDFLFIDPPYMNDQKPSRKIYDTFSRADHEELVTLLSEAHRKKVYIMMFNHDHPYLLENLKGFKTFQVDHQQLKKRSKSLWKLQ